MIKIKILYILFFAVTYALQLSANSYSPEEYEQLLVRYNKIVSRTIELKEQGVILFEYIEPRLKTVPRQKVLTGEDIRLVHEYFEKSDQLLLKDTQDFIKSMPIHSFDNLELKFTNKQTSKHYKFSILDSFLGRNPHTLVYEINPNDARGAYVLTALKMSFSVFLGMYDNFLISLAPFYNNGALRRRINNDNVENQFTLDEIIKKFVKGQQKNNLVKLYDFFKTIERLKVPAIYKQDHESLDKIINLSYSYNNFLKIQNFNSDVKKDYFFKKVKDFFVGTTSTALNELSRVFGTIIGNLKVRNSGQMLKLSYDQRQNIIQKLKPLDILIERSAFHMSNLFIPGHFGHVAIWLGTEVELRELGIWERLPEIEARAREYLSYKGPSFKDSIRQGRYIIEALRPGVQMNTFDHFLDINDMAVFRPKNLTLEERVFTLEKAFMQAGKKYDFSFDVETDKTIVCSELVYVTFEKFPWPTESSMGRYTINPDHVAELGMNENYFDIVMFYNKGRNIAYPRRTLEDILDKQKKEFLKSESLLSL